MHRIRYTAGLLPFILAGVVFATATPADKNGEVVKFPVEPYETRSAKIEFVGTEKAAVACMGNHKTYLGLYVYDANGNCVAWDDLVATKGRSPTDGLAVEWYPPETATYNVEVVNFGAATAECESIAK
jgi:hypothetical protein